jgi:hypothetical protein
MNVTKYLCLALLLGAVAGCDDKKPDSSKEPPKGTKKDDKKSEHGHGAGPNGGVIFDFGKDHAEFTVNHDKKECYILFIDGDNEKAKPLAVAATELTVTTKPSKTKDGKDVPAMTIKMKPTDAKDGKATKFVGTDPGLGNVADFEGNVVGEVGGKPAEGEFKE